MAPEKRSSKNTGKGRGFRIEGQIRRERPDSEPGEMRLAAYVFDKVGALLGSGDLDEKGNYSVALRLAEASDVELVVGPADMAEQIRTSSAYRARLSADEWKAEESEFRLKYDVLLPLDVWRPWWPMRICVSGHVRKIVHHDGVTDVCPVPFVKVEIFDVDRESCFWPLLRKWWYLLLDRPVIRIPELLTDPPFPPRPFPDPDPLPDIDPAAIADLKGRLGLSPPYRAGLASHLSESVSDEAALKMSGAAGTEVQGLPTIEAAGAATSQVPFTRVGEARVMDARIAARFDRLTLTSKVAPWYVFPHCFYSKVEVCETTTDCSGYFRCCFNWWPFHFRRGRLRFDSRPDIIIKVTQVIDGVSTVIYLDPYTSTRWNVTNAHIDLFLDDEEVVCGNGRCYDPPAGSPVFFTRIGDDEVYHISQTTGLYTEAPLANVAYGSSLLVYGQFGDDLTSGAPARYYRLSYARHGSSEFTPITASLADTRVAKSTLHSDSHTLGPKTVDGVPALYEVRDFSNYYWYNPDWLGIWHSWLAEADTDKYVLRLEVFDQNGAKLTSAMGVDYRDGTIAPPAVLPPMVDRCDLVITLDNKAPQVDLLVPAVINDCGVIPWTPALTLDFQVQVTQENNRLHRWGLYYTKGVDPTVHYLAGPFAFNGGVAGPITPTVSGATLLAGLTGTCAFALKLWAEPHIRNGRHFIFYREQMKAIAIEKCPPCPPCP